MIKIYVENVRHFPWMYDNICYEERWVYYQPRCFIDFSLKFVRFDNFYSLLKYLPAIIGDAYLSSFSPKTIIFHDVIVFQCKT